MFFFIASTEMIKMEAARAITPPSLDGMDRRITYANRKYHSGWMCRGAISGFAGLKFSTSPKMLGMFDVIVIIRIITSSMGITSFDENIGLNFIFSRAVCEFVGFEDPFSCSNIKCRITIIMITMGRMKCREKNRFRVGWLTEGPPQIHVTRSYPTIGIADSTPVITVAPQNDICPHGRT